MLTLISHRANLPGYRENTIAAIQATQQFHPDLIEIDIRSTRDNIPVLYHNRLLKKLPFRFFRHKQLPHYIPTLKEILEQFPQQRFHLDLKDDSIEHLLPLLKFQESRIIVSSYNASLLKKLNQLNPKIETKLNHWGNGIDPVSRARKIHASGIHVQHRVITSRLIKKAHANNVLVYAWTVNSEKLLFNLIRKGVNGIITDRIDRFSKIFKRPPS